MGEHAGAAKSTPRAGDTEAKTQKCAATPLAFQNLLGNSGVQYLHETAPAILRACCNGCATGEDEPRRTTVFRDARGAGPVRADLSGVSSTSSRLEAGVRAQAESDFGVDFSDVRVHRDASSDRAARDLHANAFTVGRHIFFRGGTYAPETPEGYRLLAHELTHTLQSPEDVTPRSDLPVSTPDEPAEREAERVARSIADAGTIDGAAIGKSSPAVLGDFFDDVSSTVGSAYDVVSSAVSDAGSAVAGAVSSATDTVKSVAGSAGSALSAVASTVSVDPEQTRKNLIAQANDAQSKVQSTDPEQISIDASQIASLNDKIGSLNAVSAAALPLVPALPAIPAILETIGEIIAAIIAFLLSAEVAVILAIAIIVLAIIALILWLLRGPPPAPITKPSPAPAPRVAPEPKPPPEPEPKPTPRPPPPVPIPPICMPTGYTPLDAIPMTWFKPRVNDYYPREIIVGGDRYGRDDPPTTLPHGEPIGVEERYWPHIGKVFQILPTTRGPAAGRFRAVLAGYGFNWAGLQADHVQDIEFEGPDDFDNLWPLDSSANMSAGARTNGQMISMCVTGRDPAPTVGTFATLKATVPGFYGRYFRIASITR